MSRNNENLERLLQKFVDSSLAEQMAEDIRHADAAFDAHPAPSAPQKTIAEIKQQVYKQLTLAKHQRTGLRRLSIAAGIVFILAGLSAICWNIGITSHPAQHPAIMTKGFYTTDTFAAEIEEEIGELSDDVKEINTDPYEPIDTLQMNLNEIEDQLIASNTEFWKG